jgi:hypothetical protein
MLVLTLRVQRPPDWLRFRRGRRIWLDMHHPELKDGPIVPAHTAHLCGRIVQLKTAGQTGVSTLHDSSLTH